PQLRVSARARGGGMRRPTAPGGRIVVKVGSSSLVGPDLRLDETSVEKTALQVAEAWRAGFPTILVSSGAVAAGLADLGLEVRPPDLPGLQTAAAVGQVRLMHSYSEA